MDHKTKKLDNIELQREKIVQSIQTLNQKIKFQLETEMFIEQFYVDQREQLINALTLSEKINGPIGAEIVDLLKKEQEELEKIIKMKIDESYQEIVTHNNKTKDLKKYNLKNVR